MALEAWNKVGSFTWKKKKQEVSEPLSSCNQTFYNNYNKVATAAYMPSIQAPDHELDILKTVVKMYMSEQLRQTFSHTCRSAAVF